MATQAEIEALAVRKEIEANLRAQAAGFSDAAARERDANERSIEAGFTSAVDQEIDANRRAREAGFLNAAVKENPAAAAPGTSIYSNAPFVDPRTVTPRSMHTAGPARLPASRPLNYAMPTFQGPDYYNQMFNRPLQNWSQFMPSNSRLAGGGGALYQNPWGYGTGGGSGWGGSFGGGGMMGGGYPGGGFIGGGGYPGGGPFPGGSWFPGGGGGPLGPRPGSDKANDLAAGRTHHPQMYDLDDNWVGAEGTPMGGGTRGLLGATQGSTGEITGNAPAWENPNLYGTDFFGGDVTGFNMPGTDFFGGDVTAPAGTDFFGGDVTAPAGTDFYGGDVTSPTGPNTAPPGSGPGVDFWGGGVTSPTGPNTGVPGFGPGVDFYGGGVTSPTGPNTGVPGSGPGVDFWGGGVTAPMGPNTGLPGLAEMQAAQAQAQAANAAAIAAYGGGDYGLLEGGGGAEVDVSGGNGRGGWDSGEHR